MKKNPTSVQDVIIIAPSKQNTVLGKKMRQAKEWFGKLSRWQKIAFVAGVVLGSFVFVAGVVFSLRAFGLGKWGVSSPIEDNQSSFSAQSTSSASKNEPLLDHESLLDGVFVTKEEFEKSTSRPVVGVTLDNHVDARPHSGLSAAELVYEVEAEGGITRLLAFYSRNEPAKVGPVRSARTYFLDWISEFDALYAHVGGAECNDSVALKARARCQIVTYGIKDLDDMWVGSRAYWREATKLAPHNMFTDVAKLREVAKSKGWSTFTSFEAWEFKNDASVGSRGESQSVEFDFGRGGANGNSYALKWLYERGKNDYLRYNAGVEDKDAISGEQIAAKNVVLQFVTRTLAGDTYGHLLFGTIGEGRALVFRDGEVIDGIWKKATRVSRTKFFDASGKEVEFNRGTTWIEVVPIGTTVSYI